MCTTTLFQIERVAANILWGREPQWTRWTFRRIRLATLPPIRPHCPLSGHTTPYQATLTLSWNGLANTFSPRFKAERDPGVKYVSSSSRGRFFAKWQGVTQLQGVTQPSSLCCHPLKGVLSDSRSANTCNSSSSSCDTSLCSLSTASKSCIWHLHPTIRRQNNWAKEALPLPC